MVPVVLQEREGRSRKQLSSTGRAVAEINLEPGLIFTAMALLMVLNKMKAASVITEPSCAGVVQDPEIGL